MARPPTDSPEFEAALQRAIDLVSLEWTPATQDDLDSMEPLVVELVRELRRGQTQRDRDRESTPAQGRRIAGHDPTTPARAPTEADATPP